MRAKHPLSNVKLEKMVITPIGSSQHLETAAMLNFLTQPPVQESRT